MSEGPAAGTPFQVLPWEREFLAGTFRKGVSVAALSVARGNGKTALVGGLAAGAIHPEGPLHRPRGQTVIVAGSLAQADAAFQHCRWFLEGMGCDLRKRTVWRNRDSATIKHLEHIATGAKVVARGADPDLLHGLAPSLVLADEPAKWRRSKARAVFVALLTALGKESGARLVALGTKPEAEDHWFARLCDSPKRGEYALVFDAPEGADPWDPATWRKANPSLGGPGFEVLAEQIGREARTARDDPAMRPAFMAYRLNQGTADVDADLVLDLVVYRERCESEVLPPAEGPYALGVDLGGNDSMSAAAGYWSETGLLLIVGAWPTEPGLRERGARHHVGDLYARMADRGELLPIGHHSVGAGELLAEVLGRWGRPAMIAADHWRIDDMREALHRVGLAGVPFTGVRNNYQDGGQYLREFRRAVRDREVTTPPSLLLRTALAEARVTTYDGMERLASASSGGRRRSSRDDALMASVLAVGLGCRDHRAKGGDPPPRSTRSEPEAARRVLMVTADTVVYSDGTVRQRIQDGP
ncbi:MAG: hypothetical protein F4X00_01190 [Gemmatimonadetes bacterium]|nr:hypothetical protein [Gemmatimonadota bacterium]